MNSTSAESMSEPTMPPGREILICNLGMVPYEPTWRLQKKLQLELIDGTSNETLLICEHRPVITFGTSASETSLLVSSEELGKRGVELYRVERGGDVTWHGPGQLVAYPILNLALSRKDVAWYMRSLEEVIIRTLSNFQISGIRIPGRAGVWIDEKRKIASTGVRISRWCTMHGLALNVCCGQEGFSLINPCGFADVRAVSMRDLGQEVTVSQVFPVFKRNFLDIFRLESRS